ncbi:RING-type E3 ubiquitin-protein ligase PPIL2 [Culicoides brevitarsis]|uniref:RING-type E3 ubiquitin-protein ligase PPIL2 n=1 Tax=Culicoides brevitarsis TaxID=469753 RepID=UPI00307BE6A2
MGKRQHQKDKMYLTSTEWRETYGGKKVESSENEYIKFKRLPFDHCSITMAPFEHPYCDDDGNCFDLQAIHDFLKQFKVNPITGKPLDAKSLIKLNFYKNNEGEYHCPALFKPFTKNSHIVANRVTGNVFSYEAIEQLNIKAKNWKDLVDDTPFTRKDLITIQDQSNLEKFNITTFYHIKKKLKVETEAEMLERLAGAQGRLKKVSNETKDILNQLEKDYKAPEEKIVEKKTADKFNAAHYSTGQVAASFTSTAMVPVYEHEAAIIDEDLVRYERVKKKGYVRVITNLGPLNFELHCDLTPKACENFIKHCANGYYNGTKFHRSIRNFMIQGGDPTGSGLGGESIWGKKFDDEFQPNLSHSGRGILAMANSGPSTNGSQFYITFRSCKHLDGKHTIFGKLVGGNEVLTEMERIEVDNKDKPIYDIVIEKCQVFVDPFQEADEQLAKERAEEASKVAVEATVKQKAKQKAQPLTVFRSGVGKYLNKEIVKAAASTSAEETPPAKKAKTEKVLGKFGDFKGW